MDPITLGLMATASIANGLRPSTPVTAPQRADGYALGGETQGTAGGANTGTAYSGSNGMAYGGAYSQANVDGSNWVVATGIGSSAKGDGKSGGNGGVSPSTNLSTPQSPFLQPLAATAESAAKSLQSSGAMLFIGLAILAYIVVKK